MASKKSAKKPAAKKAAAAPKSRAKVTLTSTSQAIARDTFLTLMRRCKSPENKIAEYRGELGGIIADAVEHKNLHKKAFSWARQLQRMEGVKLGEFLFHFDLYREYLEVDKQAAADMLEDRKRQAAEAAEEAKAEKAAAAAAKKNGKDDHGVKPDMKSGAVSLDAKRAERAAASDPGDKPPAAASASEQAGATLN